MEDRKQTEGEGANLVVSGEKGRGWKTGSREREREPIHDPVVRGE